MSPQFSKGTDLGADEVLKTRSGSGQSEGFSAGCHCLTEGAAAGRAGREAEAGIAGRTQHERPQAQRGQLGSVRKNAPLVETVCVNTSRALNSHTIAAFTFVAVPAAFPAATTAYFLFLALASASSSFLIYLSGSLLKSFTQSLQQNLISRPLYS